MADIIRFADIASTNDEVTERAHKGTSDGLWVMADQQSAGRGRRGRAWHSPVGNLYCSTLVRRQSDEPPLQQLSFVAAIALHETLDRYAQGIQLKWPNDLLLAGKKLSGILLEAGSSGAGSWVVVGFGVNLAHFPEDTERPATSLAANMHEPPPEPLALLEKLAMCFVAWRGIWRQHGFLPIRTQWLRHATGIDKRIEVRLGQETLYGLFVGLDDTGALLLQLDSGVIRAVHAGEVFGV